MNLPLITCIMPTANRPGYVSIAISSFLEQDYQNAEMVIIDDGTEVANTRIPDHPKIRYFCAEPLGSIGMKRNAACEMAKGEIILHWDDDDIYASDWITRQVNALISSGADITGLNKIMLQSFTSDLSFTYEDKKEELPWLCGATFAYQKSLWDHYHFADLQIGEDIDFLVNSGGKIVAMDYFEGFIAGLHATNTGIRYMENINPIKMD